jgi:hypothetical protein
VQLRPSADSNLAELPFFIDTHIIDATDDAATRLHRLHREGWIRLQRSDTMDFELSTAPDEKRAALMTASSSYPEALGVAVLNHSFAGTSVLASEEDADRVDAVFSIMLPNSGKSMVRDSHVHDAMHIATAIGYGGYGFVTRDKRLLNKDGEISTRFNGFRILTPEHALEIAMTRITDLRELHRRGSERGPLPTWP